MTDLTSLLTLLEVHSEWIIAHPGGKTFSISANEIEIEPSNDRILLSFLDDDGYQTWRVTELEFVDSRIRFDLVRNFGKETTRIELVPRTNAEEFSAQIELAKLKRANQIAAQLVSDVEGITLERTELNKAGGRLAQITIRDRMKIPIAVVADVSESVSPEAILTFSITWLSRLEVRKKNPIEEIWIVAEYRTAGKLRKLHACLRKSFKDAVRIFRIQSKDKSGKDTASEISSVSPLGLDSVWKLKPAKMYVVKNMELTAISQEVKRFAPEKIDHLFSKKGETLRYLGLPFLRVRQFLGKEQGWFGIEQDRLSLNSDSHEELYELLLNLKKYRRHDTPNTQHILYQMSSEAWLESILRANTKLLDANLILSPIYNLFRTSRDKIDLLALRNDGRLVIVELKVDTDREMIFQAVDYWQKLELQRRNGLLDRANLFGRLKIADRPAIIYLVSPTLSYHRNLDLFARAVSKQIEIFRFDIAENWRQELKVVGRKRL